MVSCILRNAITQVNKLKDRVDYQRENNFGMHKLESHEIVVQGPYEMSAHNQEGDPDESMSKVIGKE